MSAPGPHETDLPDQLCSQPMLESISIFIQKCSLYFSHMVGTSVSPIFNIGTCALEEILFKVQTDFEIILSTTWYVLGICICSFIELTKSQIKSCHPVN